MIAKTIYDNYIVNTMEIATRLLKSITEEHGLEVTKVEINYSYLRIFFDGKQSKEVCEAIEEQFKKEFQSGAEVLISHVNHSTYVEIYKAIEE